MKSIMPVRLSPRTNRFRKLVVFFKEATLDQER
jgi:hypothetical protein